VTADREAIVPPAWRSFYVRARVPAAFRVGRTLHVSGTTGSRDDGTFPDDPREEFRLALEELTATLAAAGATWADVVSITSYHTAMHEHIDAFLEELARFVAEPSPAHTAVGVTTLYRPDAKMEIALVAVLPED
jgi:enamine deaminase RidA (YjgF/YER057c/UK114 family)